MEEWGVPLHLAHLEKRGMHRLVKGGQPGMQSFGTPIVRKGLSAMTVWVACLYL